MKSTKARIARHQNGEEASQADTTIRDPDEIDASMDTVNQTPTRVEVANGIDANQACDNSMQIEGENLKGSANKGDTPRLLILFNYPLMYLCSHSQEGPITNTIATSKS